MDQKNKIELPEELLDRIADKIQETIHEELGIIADLYFNDPVIETDEHDLVYVIDFEAKAEPYKDEFVSNYYGQISYYEEEYDGIDADGYVTIYKIDNDYKFDIIFDKFKIIPYRNQS